jgi:branched-chain amino acid aminotransferase
MTAPAKESARPVGSSAAGPATGLAPASETKAEKKHPALLWFNGKLVPWESANVHVMTHALHYGSSVFEGMRCYNTPRGPALFRAKEHMRRFIDSGRVYRMVLPGLDELIEASKLVVRENGLKDAYLRPLAWRGAGPLGVNGSKLPIEIMIAAMPWGAYLGEGALENGVDVGISSWQRPGPNTIPQGAKAGGNYLSGQLIAMEAERLGYAEGIALDVDGTVSEGSGENIFVIRDGVIVTPPAASSILPGITRDTLITLARDHGYEVRQERIPREALYGADEIFFTGTAAEVTPIRSVDRIQIGAGKRGPVTAELQSAFFAAVRGEGEDRYGWLTAV